MGTRYARFGAYSVSQVGFPSAIRPADLEAAGTVECGPITLSKPSSDSCLPTFAGLRSPSAMTSNTTSSLVMRYPAASVSLIAPITTSNMLPLGLQRRLDPSTVAKERYGFNIVAVVDDMKRICYLHWGLSASAGDKSMRLHAHPDDNFDDGNTS
jgi:hypothetical protein